MFFNFLSTLLFVFAICTCVASSKIVPSSIKTVDEANNIAPSDKQLTNQRPFIVDVTKGRPTTGRVMGLESHIISPSEVRAFGLSDADVYSKIRDYWANQGDTDLLLPNCRASTCTPATCYCVPRNYSFEEVDIFFNTLRVNVRSETTSTVQLGRSRNTNKSSREGSFPADISISVRNVMQSKWFGGEAFPLTRTVQHTGFDESRRSTLFSFRTNWGFNGNTFQSSTIRSPNSERVTLQPGQSSIATLNAQKTILSLTVSYLISSGGFLVVNYDPQFQGRNDWALPASRNIFNRATITVEEQLEIEYYSNPSVTFSRPSGL